MSSLPRQDADPLDYQSLAEQVKLRTGQGKELTGVLSKLAKFVFSLLYLLASGAAAMGIPLTRHRIGLLTVVVHGGLGLLFLIIFASRTPPGPARAIVGIWIFAVCIRLISELVLAVIHLLRPRPPHRHRWSGGEFAPPLNWVWMRLHGLIGSRLPSHAWIPEMGFFALLFVALLFAEGLYNKSQGVSEPLYGLGLPLLTLQGLVGQQLVMRFRGAWQVQVLLDTQQEQQDLSERIVASSDAGRDREVDAVASMPKPRKYGSVRKPRTESPRLVKDTDGRIRP